MGILKFTQEHKEFRRRLVSFIDQEINPHVNHWEKEHLTPRDAWRKIGRGGFLCPTVSEAYGGIGGDFLHSVIFQEEFSRTNHYGLFAGLHSDIIVPYIVTFGSEAQKQQYLPGCVSGDIVTAVAMTEPDAGSDLAALATTAVWESDEVVLNGAKTFISNGTHADLVIVAARDPEVENPYVAISLFLVDDGTPGFKKGERLEKLGMHSQDTAELFFTNCRISKDNLLGERGAGFKMLMNKLQQERLVVALMAVYAADYTLRWTLSHRQRTGQAGTGQAAQFALAEMATDVRVARVFLEKLVADHMDCQEIVLDTAMAKYWTTELANRVADGCLDILGPAGALESCPIVRTWRDVRVMPIFAGTNEIMKQIVAKGLGA